jgi:hypothetical protein
MGDVVVLKIDAYLDLVSRVGRLNGQVLSVDWPLRFAVSAELHDLKKSMLALGGLDDAVKLHLTSFDK